MSDFSDGGQSYMKRVGDNLAVLVAACESLLSDHNDFWVLASLTDCSYEEGTRNDDFVPSVHLYQRAGVPDLLLEQLRKGINGNLADALVGTVPEVTLTSRNKGKGQDFEWASTGRDLARAEIKLIYDCTGPGYYKRVAADFDKLVLVRDCGYTGDLFLVVFFVELPNHDYPRGQWQGRGRLSRPRNEYLRVSGIESQYQKLRRHLDIEPAWPDQGLRLRQLSPQLTLVEPRVLRSRYEEFFWSEASWEFSLERALKGAAVGVGIWQCPNAR